MTGPSRDPKPRAKILAIPMAVHDQCREELRLQSQPDPSGCILWTGRLVEGYGRARVSIDGVRRTTSAHRLAWLLERGPIDDTELVLDHLCRNRACLNVQHLELVTAEENSRRGDSWQRKPRDPVAVDRDACRNGHPWPENAAEGWIRGRQQLYCLECRRQAYRRWYARQRAERALG